jgi:hypothetical protein
MFSTEPVDHVGPKILTCWLDLITHDEYHNTIFLFACEFFNLSLAPQ